MIIMEYNDQSRLDVVDEADVSRTLSNNHTYCLTKRGQARIHLAAKLKDRTTHNGNACPAICEINTFTRDPSPTGVLATRSSGQSSGYLRNRRNVISASAQVRKSATDKGPRAECTEPDGQQWSQYMTLSQVHKILRPYREGKANMAPKPNSHFPDIRINIAPAVTQSYPNIKVTVSGKDGVGSLAMFGNKIKQEKSGRSKSALTKTNKDGALPRMQPHVGGTNLPGRNYLGAANILYNLDRKQIKSADKTRQWIAANPLGTECIMDDDDSVTLDFDVEKPPQTRQLSLEIMQRSAARQLHRTPHAPNTKKLNHPSHCTTIPTTDCVRSRPEAAQNDSHLGTKRLNQSRDEHMSDDDTITADDCAPYRETPAPIQSSTSQDQTRDKHKKSVRFGSKNWIIKDDTYLFE